MEPNFDLPDPHGRIASQASGPWYSGCTAPAAQAFHELGVELEGLALQAHKYLQSRVQNPKQEGCAFARMLPPLDAQWLELLQRADLTGQERMHLALWLRSAHVMKRLDEGFQELLPLLPQCHHPLSGIPPKLEVLAKEVCTMLHECLEALEDEDLLLAQDVLDRMARIQRLGHETRSRITQVMMTDARNMAWAHTCFSVLNGWEEAAVCTLHLAEQVNVSHQLASLSSEANSSMQSRSPHAPCSPA